MTSRYKQAAVALLAWIVAPCVESSAQAVLSIDRDSGSVVFRNDNTTEQINFDGYEITSTLGLLDPAVWSSLSDNLVANWQEASNASENGVAEFNPVAGESAELLAGQSVSFGNAYKTDVSAAMSAVGFGNDYEDVSFRYADAIANNFVDGVAVEYTGAERFNDLVLEIEVASGVSRIINESPESVSIDFYQATSDDGALDTSFDGLTVGGSPVAGWSTGGSNTTNGLAQFFATPASGFTVAGGDVFELGTAFDAGNASRDVDFLFHIIDGDDAGFAGAVRYLEVESLLGDFNSDGSVNAADYTVWRDNLGSPESIINNAGDGSGIVDAADYGVWADNYGATSMAPSVAIPEPSTVLFAIFGLTIVAAQRRA